MSCANSGAERQTRSVRLSGVQTLVNETAPILTLGALATFVPWHQNVHGIQPSLDMILLFDKAWIGAWHQNSAPPAGLSASATETETNP